MATGATVFVVDDDASVRDGLSLQLEAAGCTVATYASAEEFLSAPLPDCAGCLVLDVRMPGMSGPELQKELLRQGSRLPVIFLTGYGDIPLAVKTIQSGAMDFLTKPVDGQILLERVRAALQLSQQTRQRESSYQAIRQRLASLTERERQVLELAIAGHANKEISRILSISARTVEHHRSHILLKTGAANLFELARMVDACQERDPLLPRFDD
ncbi:MAG: response regulator transcription factor [Methylococcaceae bacterium]|nr:response regulator transcription factor [Methylococcaceae bacterium]